MVAERYSGRDDNGKGVLTSVDTYFRDAGETELLSPDEEQALVRQLRGRYRVDSHILQHVRDSVVKEQGADRFAFLEKLFSSGSDGANLRAKPVTSEYAEAHDVVGEEKALIELLEKKARKTPKVITSIQRDLEAVSAFVSNGNKNGFHKPKGAKDCTQQLRNMQVSGIQARDHLLRANTRLVTSIARVQGVGRLEFDDRIGFGNLGLIRAAEGFDTDFGCKFSTYATYWIKQTIKRAAIYHGSTIPIPPYMIELVM